MLDLDEYILDHEADYPLEWDTTQKGTTNWPKLIQVLKVALADETFWDQSAWAAEASDEAEEACGTTYCLAGWTAALEGWRILLDESGRPSAGNVWVKLPGDVELPPYTVDWNIDWDTTTHQSTWLAKNLGIKPGDGRMSTEIDEIAERILGLHPSDGIRLFYTTDNERMLIMLKCMAIRDGVELPEWLSNRIERSMEHFRKLYKESHKFYLRSYGGWE